MASPHDKNSSKKSFDLKSCKYFSLKEVEEKLNIEYSKNRHQLLKMAILYCRKLTKIEPEDLIHETSIRFLQGTRKWKKDSKFFYTFKGAMRTIADQKYQNEKKTVSESRIKNDEEHSVYENMPDQNLNPEEEIICNQNQTNLKTIARNLLLNDKLAQNFFDLCFEGYKRKKIMKKLQINDRQYNTLYKKVHRRTIKIRK